MKKLQQIDRLVEEAYGKLCIITNPDPKKCVTLILTDLAKKCAEINEQDWLDTAMNLDRVQLYNSRLREGQVQIEPKQECDLRPNERFFIDERGGCIAVRDKKHPNYDHTYPGLHETTPDVIFYGHGYRENGDGNWMIGELTRKKANEVLAHLISMHTPSQPALEPLPEKMPEWLKESLTEVYNNRMDTKTFYDLLRQHFGTQPREWWMDLKKGDKFINHRGHVVDFLAFALSYSDGTNQNDPSAVQLCRPYTASPLDQLLSTFTPQQKALWDQVKEGKDE